MLTQKEAVEIAKKLQAEIKTGRKHDIVVIRFDETYVGQFNIQRSSKDKSHDYISHQMLITAKQCREFHQCSLSRQDYIEILRAKSPSPLSRA
jgi:3-dehydroquinate dehydratase